MYACYYMAQFIQVNIRITLELLHSAILRALFYNEIHIQIRNFEYRFSFILLMQ